ncbi:cupin domain-containing protein [Clostridium sp. DL1XJH146]
MNEKLIEIREYKEEGYSPVIDYDKWRVAILNYCDELLPHNISKFQKHDESDEVFVLLSGKFSLFIGEGKEEIDNIFKVDLEPLKLYNVKKSTWHSHTLSKDASVLIVENRNTDLSNSPEIELTENQKNKLVNL